MAKATLAVGNIRISGSPEALQQFGQQADIATEASIEAQLAEAKLLIEQAPGMQEAKGLMARLANFSELMGGLTVGAGWQYAGSYGESFFSFLGSGWAPLHRVRHIATGRIALVASYELAYFEGIKQGLEEAEEIAKQQERLLSSGSSPKQAAQKAAQAAKTPAAKPITKSRLSGGAPADLLAQLAKLGG